MKRFFVIVAVLLASLLGQTRAQAQQVTYTKVGVVNMGVIYTQYQRVKDFKGELERDADPFKKKKVDLDKYINGWTAHLNDPKCTPEQREQGMKIIIDCKRKLEDLDQEFKREFSKKLEGQMTILNKEINERIQGYASANGYHIIFAFGEPETPLQGLTGFKRSMTVIDQGGMTIAYVAPGMDISPQIVQSLNGSYRPGAVPTPAPAGGAPVSTPR